MIALSPDNIRIPPLPQKDKKRYIDDGGILHHPAKASMPQIVLARPE